MQSLRSVASGDIRHARFERGDRWFKRVIDASSTGEMPPTGWAVIDELQEFLIDALNEGLVYWEDPLQTVQPRQVSPTEEVAPSPFSIPRELLEPPGLDLSVSDTGFNVPQGRMQQGAASSSGQPVGLRESERQRIADQSGKGGVFAQYEGRMNDGMDLLLGRSRGRLEHNVEEFRTPQVDDVPPGRSRAREQSRNPSRSGS